MAKNVLDMSREEWLQKRTKGIGGSDAGVILGVNKYKTPFELWLEKTGQSTSDSSSEAAYFGNLLEDLVAKEFERRSGKKVRRNNFMLQHPKYPFITANIDRKVVGEDALLECKTASAFLVNDWEDDKVPAPYLAQVQHYLGVTGYKHAYIAVLIGGQRFTWKEIERDDELIEMIFDEEIKFWKNHVEANVPPALDGSSAAEQFLKERYKEADPGKVIDLSFENKEKLDELQKINARIKKLQEQKREIENAIKNELKDAETGFVQGYEVNWKSVTSNRLDTRRLRKEKPEIYDEYVKQSTYRRFNVKEID